MASKEEKVRELDKLLVELSGMFLAILLGFAPSWLDRIERSIEEIPAIPESAKILVVVVFFFFILAFLLSLTNFVAPWTIDRSWWLRAVTVNLLIMGVIHGLLVLLVTFMIPEILSDWLLWLAMIVAFFILLLTEMWGLVKQYFEWAEAPSTKPKKSPNNL